MLGGQVITVFYSFIRRITQCSISRSGKQEGDEHIILIFIWLAGFTGSQCDVGVDNCHQVSCNYGVCMATLTGYSCQCQAGYTGQSCDTEINECLSSPCLQGATCIDLVNGFNCSCAPGTNGVLGCIVLVSCGCC